MAPSTSCRTRPSVSARGGRGQVVGRCRAVFASFEAEMRGSFAGYWRIILRATRPPVQRQAVPGLAARSA